MRRRLLLALMAALPATARAQAPRPTTQGPLGHLSRLIGTYDYNAVFTDRSVSQALSAMLGAQGVRLLRTNTTVASPIAFDGSWLILRGLAPHLGGSEEAILGVQPSTGRVDTAILSNGRILHVAQQARMNSGDAITAWIAERSQGGRVPVEFRQQGAPGGGKPG